MATSRCTEARLRLALAEGSLLGASILCIIGIRMDAGNEVALAAIVVKAT